MRETLTAAMARRKIDPAALAEQTGLSLAQIYRLKGGYIDNPKAKTVEALEAALKLRPGALVFTRMDA